MKAFLLKTQHVWKTRYIHYFWITWSTALACPTSAHPKNLDICLAYFNTNKALSRPARSKEDLPNKLSPENCVNPYKKIAKAAEVVHRESKRNRATSKCLFLTARRSN